MVRVTYDNFREIECDYVKYVSRKRGKFKINIINFKEFRYELLENYSEEQIQKFFRLFPYDLDTEIRTVDKFASILLEIEFYDDLHLITVEGQEFVLVDHSTEDLIVLKFLSRTQSQPIPLKEFVLISMFDFIDVAQQDLFYSLELNLKESKVDESKYVEKVKDSLYI